LQLSLVFKFTLFASMTGPFRAGVPDLNQVLKTDGATVQVMSGAGFVGRTWALAEFMAVPIAKVQKTVILIKFCEDASARKYRIMTVPSYWMI